MSTSTIFAALAWLAALVAVLLTVPAAALNITAEQAKLIDGVIHNLASAYLNKSADRLAAQFTNPTQSCSGYVTSCTSTTATDSLLPAVNYTAGIAAGGPNDAVQLRPTPGLYSLLEADQAGVCALNSLKSVYSANFVASSHALLSQYSVLADSGIMGRYPARTANCTTKYYPRRRPFYASGAAGAKDIVIAIDLSTMDSDSAWRVTTSKRMITELLATLSFRDFVNVLVYDSSSARALISGGLVQGTADNIALLTATLNNVTVPADGARTGAKIGAAMVMAQAMLASAASSTSTSNCTKAIALFSSGFNDAGAPTIPTVLEAMDAPKNAEQIVFAFWVGGKNVTSDERRARLGTLACRSRGLLVRVSEDGQDGAWTAMLQYFAALAPKRETRVSNAYLDAFTNSPVVSLSMPVATTALNTGVSTLRAVTTLDVDFNAAFAAAVPGLTRADFDAYLLTKTQCQPLRQRAAEAAATVAALQKSIGGDTCANLGMTYPELGWRASYAGWVCLSVFGAIFIGCCPILWGLKVMNPSRRAQRESRIFMTFISSGMFFVFTLISLCVFWFLVYPDLMVATWWTETRLVVETPPKENPYRCCGKVDCMVDSCASAPAGAPLCTTALTQLIEGLCDDGYRCCKTVCYSCNCVEVYACHTTYSTDAEGKSTSSESCGYETECDTCCDCVKETFALQCRSKCGTCYKPSVAVSGEYAGRPMVVSFGTECGMDNTGCVRDFTSRYAVGNTVALWVNPENPNEYRDTADPRPAPLGAFIAMSVLAGISLLAMIVAWKTFLRGNECLRFWCLGCLASDNDDSNGNGDNTAAPSGMDAVKEDVKMQPMVATADRGSDDGGNILDLSTYQPMQPADANAAAIGVGDDVPPPAGGYDFTTTSSNTATAAPGDVPASAAPSASEVYAPSQPRVVPPQPVPAGPQNPFSL